MKKIIKFILNLIFPATFAFYSQRLKAKVWLKPTSKSKSNGHYFLKAKTADGILTRQVSKLVYNNLDVEEEE